MGVVWFLGASPSVTVAAIGIAMRSGEQHQMTLWNWAVCAVAALAGGSVTTFLYRKLSND